MTVYTNNKSDFCFTCSQRAVIKDKHIHFIGNKTKINKNNNVHMCVCTVNIKKKLRP